MTSQNVCASSRKRRLSHKISNLGCSVSIGAQTLRKRPRWLTRQSLGGGRPRRKPNASIFLMRRIEGGATHAENRTEGNEGNEEQSSHAEARSPQSIGGQRHMDHKGERGRIRAPSPQQRIYPRRRTLSPESKPSAEQNSPEGAEKRRPNTRANRSCRSPYSASLRRERRELSATPAKPAPKTESRGRGKRLRRSLLLCSAPAPAGKPRTTLG